MQQQYQQAQPVTLSSSAVASNNNSNGGHMHQQNGVRPTAGGQHQVVQIPVQVVNRNAMDQYHQHANELSKGIDK
jgi:hypothetical protein